MNSEHTSELPGEFECAKHLVIPGQDNEGKEIRKIRRRSGEDHEDQEKIMRRIYSVDQDDLKQTDQDQV